MMNFIININDDDDDNEDTSSLSYNDRQTI